MRIVVSGLAATYPLGGVFWDYAQYLLGFRRLGHDVLYVEDTGQWCYDPTQGTFVESGKKNADYLQLELGKLSSGSPPCWFMRDAAGATYGMDWSRAAAFCRSADLFLNVSASCTPRDEYLSAEITAFIDSDPMYTQANVPAYLAGSCDEAARARIDSLRQHHDVHFTFAEKIGDPDCCVPTELFRWKTTRQPIDTALLRTCRSPASERRRVLTTVASWETNQGGPNVGGVQYRGKNSEFMRFIDLPQRSSLPLEVALSGKAPLAQMADHGWKVVDPLPRTRRPAEYLNYLAGSLGEFSVAKHAYVASRSGWFSCRSACYLALGVPVIVQDTGFSELFPTGEGLFAFSTEDEALAAIDALAAEPDRHFSAAAEIAQEYFDGSKVLTALLNDAMSSARAEPPIDIRQPEADSFASAAAPPGGPAGASH